MKDKVKEAFSLKINLKSVGILFLWAFLLNFIVETLQRVYANGVVTGGLTGGLVAMVKQPFIFFYGVLLLMAMLSPGYLFKRRYFVMGVISFVWLAFGISDFVLLSYRVTPFSVIELKLIDAAVGVLTKYVSIPGIILIAALSAGGVVLLVFCWRKAPRAENFNRLRGFFAVLVMAVLLTASTVFGFVTDRLSTSFPNLANAYLDYGFVYCFLNGINMGIHKPADYSEEKVSEIVSGTKEPEEETASPTDDASEEQKPEEQETAARPVVVKPNMTGPNVIFLQLESFFDITAVQSLQISEDPIPFFRSLKQQYSSGYLSVPAIGAGTANTEFEVMTGMNLDFFGPGEYPYKTVLETQTCESLAYNMKENGYTAHAIHNNRANFYSRNEIFSQLGYDDFTSIEVMNVTEFTPNGWAKDKCLTKEITKVLDSTENRDYVYTISVQGHGKYPKDPELMPNPKIKLLSGIDDDRKYGVEYYINEINEMDQFLQELVAALSARNEPTILVAYGDHLPGLGFTQEDLVNKNMNQTEYVIWNNIGLPKADEDIEAYQLASRVLERINIKTGVINAYHQANKDTDQQEYLDNLKILGYDMLYGDKDAIGGEENKYVATDLKFGVTNVRIRDIEQDPANPSLVTIKGDYFTSYSRVMCGDEKLNSIFVDEHTLRAELPDFEEDEPLSFVVEQNYKGKLLLQTSNEMIVRLEATANIGEDFQDNNENFE